VRPDFSWNKRPGLFTCQAKQRRVALSSAQIAQRLQRQRTNRASSRSVRTQKSRPRGTGGKRRFGVRARRRECGTRRRQECPSSRSLQGPYEIHIWLEAALLAMTFFQCLLQPYRAAKHLGACGQRRVTKLKGRKLAPRHVVLRLVA